MTLLALVHLDRDPACSAAVAALLRSSRHGFDVHYVGRRELTPQTLARAALYAQPGGGELAPAYRRLRRHRTTIRDYVGRGGRYLGFCLGGYLAGATPGFDLLPGDTDRQSPDPGDTVVEVEWRGRRRRMFFQDGPRFEVETRGTTVLARYLDGEIAALVAPFGEGRVGVVGPHPEAPADWFASAGLAEPRPPALDLGLDLVDAVMA
jgi:glutamine amidotransferase-like uncharacterized protein